MRPEPRCDECRDLERTHDRTMEEYIDLVDRQSRLFRQGYGRLAKDFDAAVYNLKSRREAAINALLGHQAAHWQRRGQVAMDQNRGVLGQSAKETPRPRTCIMASFMPHAHIHLLEIPTLDDDHLALGHIIAELELLGENNASGSVVANVMDRLVAAVRRHFAREEEIMAHDVYPFLARHRESHRQLVEFIEDLAGQLSSGRITVNEELIAALWDWETAHIDTADRDYAEYAKNRKAAPVTSD